MALMPQFKTKNILLTDGHECRFDPRIDSKSILNIFNL